MIISLNGRKHISLYRNTPIYIGEKNFDVISVFLPETINDIPTDGMSFILHLVNNTGEYFIKTFEVSSINEKKVGSTVVTADLTAIAQEYQLYIEIISSDGEKIGKTNILPIQVNPLPDETDRIIPPDQQEELEELIQVLRHQIEILYDSKTTELSDESTDDEYPSAKCVYDFISEYGGLNGKSAYEVAVDNGYQGTEQEWLASLKGEKGDTGTDGTPCTHTFDGTTLIVTSASGTSSADLKGDKGDAGEDGDSAYQIAVENGYSGTEQEWLASLKGADGQAGTNGINGKSAYELAVEAGYEGTEQDWIESLKGEKGETGERGATGDKGEKGETGTAGANGIPCTHSWNGTTLTVTSASGTSSVDLKGGTGDTGAQGKSAYQVAVDNGFVGTEAEWLISLRGANGQNGTNGQDWIPTEQELNGIAQRALNLLPSADEGAY